jgi:hypothetical protein
MRVCDHSKSFSDVLPYLQDVSDFIVLQQKEDFLVYFRRYVR